MSHRLVHAGSDPIEEDADRATDDCKRVGRISATLQPACVRADDRSKQSQPATLAANLQPTSLSARRKSEQSKAARNSELDRDMPYLRRSDLVQPGGHPNWLLQRQPLPWSLALLAKASKPLVGSVAGCLCFPLICRPLNAALSRSHPNTPALGQLARFSKA